MVGSSEIFEAKSKKLIDKWVLFGFSIVFLLIQVYLGFWFFAANKHKTKLEKEEKMFLKDFNLPRQNKANVNFNICRL